MSYLILLVFMRVFIYTYTNINVDVWVSLTHLDWISWDLKLKVEWDPGHNSKDLYQLRYPRVFACHLCTPH